MRQRFIARIAMTGVLAAVLLSCGSAPSVAEPTDSPGYPRIPTENVTGPFPVTKVSDGDTIWVNNDGEPEKVRLIGMDTPELHDPRKPVECFA
jgi:micrococcal nuclease